ncbi:hypothetical protein [Streptomyces cyaneofuscatus]|uniref:hypothetical protein n=1 Tax=Streptomyces cyaneofuscatus TaxID=66883 RepID=UPI003660CA71
MNKRMSSLSALLLAGTCLMATAGAASASSGDGDNYALAFSSGSGQANATVNDAGGNGSGGGDQPPVIGDPSTGTLQYGNAGIATIASVNLTMSYSCPTGSPSDTRIDAVVEQDNDSFGTNGTTVTCDGTVRSLQLNVAAAQSSTLYVPGPTVVTITLYSPSGSGPYARYASTINIE